MANLIADDFKIKMFYVENGLVSVLHDLIDCNPSIEVMQAIVWCLGNISDVTN